MRASLAPCLLLLAAAARADVLHVPKDFPTVAGALAAVQPGDQVVLAAGTYTELVSLDGLQDVVLRGQGEVVLVGDGSFEAPLSLTGCVGVTVERLTVRDASGVAVSVGNCSEVTLRKLRVEDAGSAGIVVGQGHDSLVDRCRVEDAALDGIVLVDEDDTTVSRCTIVGAVGIGVSFDGCAGSVVERCKITDAGAQGILLGKANPVQGCTADRNRVIDAGFFGIQTLGTDLVLTDNRVQHSSSNGCVMSAPSEGGVVRGNRLVDCAGGLSVAALGVTVQENRVVSTGSEGISLSADDGVLVDNRVIKPGGNAFGFSGSLASGSIAGCKALHPGLDGYFILGEGLMFTGNSSVGAGLQGFHVEGSGHVFTGNTAHGSLDVDITDLDGGNIYLDNDFATGFEGDPP